MGVGPSTPKPEENAFYSKIIFSPFENIWGWPKKFKVRISIKINYSTRIQWGCVDIHLFWGWPGPPGPMVTVPLYLLSLSIVP